MCTAQHSLNFQEGAEETHCIAARLEDGRVVCVDMNFDDDDDNLAMRDQILEKHGPPSGASWRWRALPDLGVEQPLGGACVLSDGRFAVFAIKQGESPWTRASKVLTVDE
jgi:hypothetical protein